MISISMPGWTIQKWLVLHTKDSVKWRQYTKLIVLLYSTNLCSTVYSHTEIALKLQKDWKYL